MIATSIICIIGCIVADHIFPCIGPLNRFIRQLPLGRKL